MSPETLAVLEALASVRWKHTQGRHADAVRAWQAAGRPDLEEARREAIRRYFQRRNRGPTCPNGHPADGGPCVAYRCERRAR